MGGACPEMITVHGSDIGGKFGLTSGDRLIKAETPKHKADG